MGRRRKQVNSKDKRADKTKTKKPGGSGKSVTFAKETDDCKQVPSEIKDNSLPGSGKSVTFAKETDDCKQVPREIKDNALPGSGKRVTFTKETDDYKRVPPEIKDNALPEVRRPALLLYGIDEKVPERYIYYINRSKLSREEKMTAPKLVVHGEIIPVPLREVGNAQFDEEIHESMRNIGYRKVKKIQSYAWPALTRGQHVFMIGKAKCGKSLAYLPAVCTFLLEKDERYKHLLKVGEGPIVLILCNNSKKCEDIYDLIRVLFDNRNVKLCLTTYPNEYGKTGEIDILVTMPTVLTSLILSNTINFKRLCHFVLEDADSLLKFHSDLLLKFLNLAQVTLQHRSCRNSVQMIVCGEHWNPQIENFTKKFRQMPLIIISNYLEAAMYGKVCPIIKLLESTRKGIELGNLLNNRYKYIKSVIFCEDDEIYYVQRTLVYKGIKCVAISKDMNGALIKYSEEYWHNAQPGEYSVLICSDTVFNNVLDVATAYLLIHYTLPSSWSEFVRRFYCFLENCNSPFVRNRSPIKLETVVFIDETCEETMENLLINIEQQFPTNAKSYFEGVKMKQEFSKADKGIPICNKLKLFGNCNKTCCVERHIITKTLDGSEHLPENGFLKFKIIGIRDVSIFEVEVLGHTDFANNFTEIVNRSIEMDENLHKAPKQRIGIPQHGHLYMYKEGDDVCRCRVLNFDENDAVISLIDIDASSAHISSIRNLYKLPNEYETLSPQTNIATVYLANYIPPYNDENFSTKAYRSVQEIMKDKCYKTSLFRGQILLRIGHTFWLKNVEEELDMFDKGLPSRGFQLSREIIVQQFAEVNETQLQNLYKLHRDAGFEIPVYEPIKKVARNIGQVAPQWAVFEMDKINEVIFCAAVSLDEFTVRISKFDKMLSNLQTRITKSLKRRFYPSIDEVIEGNCYLTKEIDGEQYCRILARKVDSDKCICYFVDYGDEVVANTSDLKYLSDELISTLPFQAIQCRLHGVAPINDCWANVSDVKILYEFAFEPNSDTFRSLHIKVCEEEHNMRIPSQRRYSVLLKDGFGESKVLINKLIIARGSAIPNGESVNDFPIPQVKLSDADMVDKSQCDGIDPVKFLENFMKIKIEDNQEENKKEKCDKPVLPKMEASLPPVEYLLPTVYWSQTSNTVKLVIELVDAKDYTIIVGKNRDFVFTCNKGGKIYKLRIILFETVQYKFQHIASGRNIRVTLTKVKQGLEWPRLIVSKEKHWNIRYDISTINFK